MSSDNFNEAMTVFTGQYQPAKSPAESDVELTTNEIKNMIVDLIDDVSLDEIYAFMKEAGFDYQFVGNGLKWLLKKV